MESLFNLLCKFSPLISTAVLVGMGLLSLALWRGGVIKEISIPSIFTIELSKPIVLKEKKYLAYVSIASFCCAIGMFAFQFFYTCSTCIGLPGQTAWIYAGNINLDTGEILQGNWIASENGDIPVQSIRAGSWIKLLAPRRTMILDYSELGTKRALDSPFKTGGTITYTCKELPAGTRLYVARKEINGPSPTDQHVWFRIRQTPPGG